MERSDVDIQRTWCRTVHNRARETPFLQLEVDTRRLLLARNISVESLNVPLQLLFLHAEILMLLQPTDPPLECGQHGLLQYKQNDTIAE